MLPELIALIDQPWLLAAVLATGAAVGIAVERFVEGQKSAKRRAYWNGQRGTGGPQSLRVMPSKRAPNDATEQLRIIMEAQFNSRPLLNAPERRVLAHLDRILAEESPGWRAMGQVSLGEILASPDANAYREVNSKRVDLLIVDSECQPLHAVEFQGKGHHQGTSAARDAIKKEALRKAGIGFVEVMSGDTPAELRMMVRKLVGRVERLA